MGIVTINEMVEALKSVALAMDLSLGEAQDYLTHVCDLTWARAVRGRGGSTTYEITDDAARLIKLFAGPNGHAMVKVHQAQKEAK